MTIVTHTDQAADDRRSRQFSYLPERGIGRITLQQTFTHHAFIARVIIGGHQTLICQGNLDLLPVEIGL